MDSEDFDDILTNSPVKNARAGSKFQPKAKPRPPKREKRLSAAHLTTSSQEVRTIGPSASELKESSEAKHPSEPDNQRSSGIDNASSKHVPASKNVDSTVILGSSGNIFVPDSNEDWPSPFQKSVGEETADIFFELDPLRDFLPDSSTVLDNAVCSSKAPVGHAPVCSNIEGKLAYPHDPAIDDSSCFSNIPRGSSQPEISAAQGPLSGNETVITSGYADNGEFETKVLESYPCLEALEISDPTNGSKKLQPKPRLLSERSQSNISNANLVDSTSTVPNQQDIHSFPAEENVMDQSSVHAFTQNVFDFSSVESGGPAADSAYEFTVNEDQASPTEPSHPGPAVPTEHLQAVPELPEKLASRRAKPRKGTTIGSDLCPKQCTSSQAEVAGRSSLRRRQKTKNTYQLQDNSEEEAAVSGVLHSTFPSVSNSNQNNNGDEEYNPEQESQTKKVERKSKKNQGNKEKPVRKRKKDNETSDQAAEVAPKKFYHSTRRRRVNKTLLETPEDDIDLRKIPIRDLILLQEHKERMAKKDATASKEHLPNQSAGNSVEPDNEGRGGADFQHYYDDEPFASEQGGEANNEDSTLRVEESSGYFNYQTYMDKTPVLRWSKQDTELFYEAVRQFGTDLTMIQQLFPSRTRRQVKLKYKKEERQHPSKLRDALTSRSRDNSHFELLIEKLQLAAVEKENSCSSNKADSIDLTGNEEKEEETPETTNNEEGEKSEQIDEEIMEDAEQEDEEEEEEEEEEEFTKVESSPVKSDHDDDSDDFMNHFSMSQFKFDL